MNLAIKYGSVWHAIEISNQIYVINPGVLGCVSDLNLCWLQVDAVTVYLDPVSNEICFIGQLFPSATPNHARFSDLG
jgi:hypothetical protein